MNISDELDAIRIEIVWGVIKSVFIHMGYDLKCEVSHGTGNVLKKTRLFKMTIQDPPSIDKDMQEKINDFLKKVKFAKVWQVKRSMKTNGKRPEGSTFDISSQKWLDFFGIGIPFHSFVSVII